MRKLIRASVLVVALAVPAFAGNIPNNITATGETPNNVTASGDIPYNVVLLTLLTLILR